MNARQERDERRSRSAAMNRMPLYVCSVYVAMPAIMGMISLTGLLSGNAGVGVHGLLLGAFFGLFFGIPLLILQCVAVFRRSSAAATGVSALYWASVALLTFGTVKLLIIGSDDESTFGLWPDAAILLAILLLNMVTAITMAKHAAKLKTIA